MMCSPVPLMLVALSTALAAPANVYEDYPITVPQKRAALVLDRLLIALQKALHDPPPSYLRAPDEPRAQALRYDDDMSERAAMAGAGDEGDQWLGPEDLRVAPLGAPVHDFSDVQPGLQRRGQTGAGGAGGAGAAGLRGRGRVLRCYFNAITCF